MSRIEEALRRASGAASSVPSGMEMEGSENQRSGSTQLTHFHGEPKTQGRGPDEPEPGARFTADSRSQSEASVKFAESLKGKLVLGDADPVAVEQYRRLAGGLLEMQLQHGVNTLMVTSAAPREGKSLTISNLALTLSETYRRRVLLIDADLRRPSLHQVFAVPGAKGLAESLHSEAAAIPLVHVSPRLSVLPAGRVGSNPLGALTSERMRKLVAEAATVFDWVLLDAPPVGLMPDASLLVSLTQGVVFVIAAGSTPHALIERAIAEVGRENIIGTVLNQVAAENIPSADYYNQYYEPAAAL